MAYRTPDLEFRIRGWEIQKLILMVLESFGPSRDVVELDIAYILGHLARTALIKIEVVPDDFSKQRMRFDLPAQSPIWDYEGITRFFTEVDAEYHIEIWRGARIQERANAKVSVSQAMAMARAAGYIGGRQDLLGRHVVASEDDRSWNVPETPWDTGDAVDLIAELLGVDRTAAAIEILLSVGDNTFEQGIDRFELRQPRTSRPKGTLNHRSIGGKQ